jgi:hypothetical protein
MALRARLVAPPPADENRLALAFGQVRKHPGIRCCSAGIAGWKAETYLSSGLWYSAPQLKPATASGWKRFFAKWRELGCLGRLKGIQVTRATARHSWRRRRFLTFGQSRGSGFLLIAPMTRPTGSSSQGMILVTCSGSVGIGPT